MKEMLLNGKLGRRVRMGALAVLATCALWCAGAGVAAAVDVPYVDATIQGTGTEKVITGSDGSAWLKLNIAQSGTYTMRSTASRGVSFDTVGYLYDSYMEEVDANDDMHADTDFCISTPLNAGTYYLQVTGKGEQAYASITVSVSAGKALGSLDYACKYAEGGAVSAFELGTRVYEGTTKWEPASASSYKVVGYVDRDVFTHAQESGAISKIAWTGGLPKGAGRFVVMATSTGGEYLGSAYYHLDEQAGTGTDSISLVDLDPRVTRYDCGAVEKIELGTSESVPTNWSTSWTAVTESYYKVNGYCTRSKFEKLGGKDSAITWTKGLPHDEGEYVVKCTATKVDGNPYTGSRYVWVSVDSPSHAGAGSWVVDKAATYSKSGKRHLKCKYCGAPCDYTTIPALKNTLETGGAGATLADYKILTKNTARYTVCLATGSKAKVPDTVKIDGVTYKVTAIAAKAFSTQSTPSSVVIGKNVAALPANAFAKCKKLKSVTVGVGVTKIGKKAFDACTKLKTLTLKTKKLAKNGTKGALKGSSVKTVKVPKAKKSAYSSLFKASVCGKSVKLK